MTIGSNDANHNRVIGGHKEQHDTTVHVDDTTTAPPTTPLPSPPIRNRDMMALKSYIQAQDATRYQNLNHDLVLLDLTHSNLQQRHIEIRFSKRYDTVAYLKQRIHLKTGTPPHFQQLTLYDDATDQVLATLPAEADGTETTTTTGGSGGGPKSVDDLPLGYFGLDHGMRVHCVDVNPYSQSARGGYEDTSLIDKYVMSDEAYQARKGTLRDWARQQKEQNPKFSLYRHAAQQRAKSEAIRMRKAGLPLPPGFYVDSRGELEYDSDYERDQVEYSKHSSQQQPTSSTTTTTQEPHGPASVEGMEVGMRCQVEPGKRRGVVQYIGEIPELSSSSGGFWIGIHLDEPLGRNDGTVVATDKKKVVYIPNLPPNSNYGLFVRPHKVQVGDFPERDLLEDEEEDEDPQPEEEEEDSEDEL